LDAKEIVKREIVKREIREKRDRREIEYKVYMIWMNRKVRREKLIKMVK
jgi:hypothetical protein